MENIIIIVNEEPYCIWDIDIDERNKKFLNGIDTEYYDYCLETYLSSPDEKRASMALRSVYHHSLETMFSFLAAFIQSPKCVYAWIAKCSNQELRDIIRKINTNKPFPTAYDNLEEISWDIISSMVFKHYLPNSEKSKKTQLQFAKLWQKLSSEFLNQNHIDEYNSFKHGFRVNSGGFTLACGTEHEYGVEPPSNEIKVIGGSELGSSFYKLEYIGERKRNRSLESKQVCINWSLNEMATTIQLIAMSIKNILTALQIANGTKASSLKFHRLSDDKIFENLWQHSPTLLNATFNIFIPEQQGKPTTRKELLEHLKKTGK